MSKLARILLGSNILDFNDIFNVKYQCYDFRDVEIGNTFKSYTIEIPLTPTNRELLGNPDMINSRVNISEIARLQQSGITIIQGTLQILDVDRNKLRAIINADDWVGEIAEKSIRDLSWTAGDNHVFSAANIKASWTAAAGAFYRYPLINFGQLYSQEEKAGAIIYPNDFAPMFNVGDILEKIFSDAGYSIDSGHFFNSTEGAKIYILGDPAAKPDSFINERDFYAYVDDVNDNIDTISHASLTTDSMAIGTSANPIKILFGAQSKDEGDDYSIASTYTAPENGTYRFTTEIQVISTHNNSPEFSSVNNIMKLYFRINGTKLYNGLSQSGANLFVSIFEIDTGFIHLEAGDVVDLYGYFYSEAYNDGPTTSASVYLSETTSYIQQTMDKRHKFRGIGATVDPATALPDIDSIDFLKALKDAYNLRFWIDKLNKKIYIESHNDFVGSTIIDWSEKIDLEFEPLQEIIVSNYAESQLMKYKPDTSDEAYNEWVNNNGTPYTKTVTLDNPSAKRGIDTLENAVFSPTILGRFIQIRHTGSIIPRIFGGEELLTGKKYPEFRPDQWQPRLLKYNGMVALGTGEWNYYEEPHDATPDNYTTYPQVETPDYSDLYSSYWVKTWGYINNGKLLKVQVVIDPSDLLQFITEQSNVANEGFRATYKLTIAGQPMYFILTNLVTDGQKAKCEFIQKM